MLKIYHFNIVKEGTPESPHFTFAEISSVKNATVNYLPQLNIVIVKMEVTKELDAVLTGTDLTEVVYIERLNSYKAECAAIRKAKNPSI